MNTKQAKRNANRLAYRLLRDCSMRINRKYFLWVHVEDMLENPVYAAKNKSRDRWTVRAKTSLIRRKRADARKRITKAINGSIWKAHVQPLFGHKGRLPSAIRDGHFVDMEMPADFQQTPEGHRAINAIVQGFNRPSYGEVFILPNMEITVEDARAMIEKFRENQPKLDPWFEAMKAGAYELAENAIKAGMLAVVEPSEEFQNEYNGIPTYADGGNLTLEKLAKAKALLLHENAAYVEESTKEIDALRDASYEAKENGHYDPNAWSPHDMESPGGPGFIIPKEEG